MLSVREPFRSVHVNLIIRRCVTKAKANLAVSESARPFEELPGPSKYQLIRGVLPGGFFYKKSAKEFARKCREEYGDLIKIPGLFGKPTMVLSYNPDHFEKVFRTEGTWPFRRPLDSINYFRDHYRKDFYQGLHGLTNSNGEEWGKLRSIVNPILMHPVNVKVYFPKVLSANNEFVERIREIRDSQTFEVPDDFLTEINKLTFENVVAVALDKELGLIRKNRNNSEALQAFDSLHQIFKLMYDVDMKPPIWRVIKTPAFKQMMNALEEIQSFLEAHVNEAIKSMDMSKKYEEQSVLQKLINIDKKFAIVMAVDMLLAGVDTTSTVFTGLLLCMGTNPDKQEILRNEIKEILPNKKSELTVEKMKNMPYLRACIKESIRLYPIGPGTARKTTQDLELNGYLIPKGTELVMNSEEISNEAKYFSHPEKFIPERWLREGSRLEQQCPVGSKAENPFVYLPFGFGPRMCVGKRIVDLELEIGLSKIIRNYKVEYNYPPEEVFTTYLLNTPKAPLRFKFTDIE